MLQRNSIIDRLTQNGIPKEDVNSLVDRIGRDIVLLLNSWQILPRTDPPANSTIASSVLNYGIANLAGKPVDSATLADLERQVRLAIARFEPRLDPSTLKVKSSRATGAGSQSEFGLSIDGELRGVDSRRQVSFRTFVNLATGRVRLV